MRTDVRFALRMFGRAPGFVLTIVVVLALGIGATSAIFSALDQVVIRPLAYSDADRLVMLWEDFSAFGVAKNRVSPATFLDWRRRSRVFQAIAAYAGPATMDLSGDGSPPEEVTGQTVTANLLPMLGVQPLLGRTFSEEEEHQDSYVVVLSYAFWQRRFGGDPALVGREIVLNRSKYTAIGIMPRGFQFPDRGTEYWVPIGISPQLWARRNSHFLKVVGRFRGDTTLAQAQQEMSGIARDLATEFPGTNRSVGITVVPLKTELLGQSRDALLILIAAAACMLLIACANAGSLLLVRASSRRREMATRAALGAEPARLVRQILTENLLISTGAGVLGLLIARWMIVAIQHLLPAALAFDLRLDARALLFSSLVTILTTVLIGLAPALKLSRLKMASRGALSEGGRFRDGLVVSETAIALVLLTGAGLMIKTLAHMRAADAGFHSEGILTAEINVAFARNQGHNQNFYKDVLDRVLAIPGVSSAGLTSDLPFTSHGNTMSIRIEGRMEQATLGQDVLFRLVSPGYLETIGAKLRRGRFLDGRDNAGATAAVVINETLARQYWPGEDPVGRRIDTGTGDGKPRWMTIVGVVHDIRERGLDLALKGAVYVPFEQTGITFFQPSEIAVATVREPMSIARELQKAVWSVDAEQPVANIRPMSVIVDEEVAGRAELLKLLGGFAGLALALAALGIYAVLAYIVSERRREIGVRVAVGATRWDIVKRVLRDATRLAGMGLAAGVAIAIAGTRLLSTMLYQVSPLDASTFTLVAALLGAVALMAAALPARRAASIDAVVALREE
jgi:predicted permease